MKTKIRYILNKNKITRFLYLKLSNLRLIIRLSIKILFNLKFRNYLLFFLLRDIRNFFGGDSLHKHLKKYNSLLLDSDFTDKKYITINDFDVVYINLKNRVDRKKQIVDEFNNLNIQNYERFEAHKHNNGAIGCGLSHREVLQNFKESKKELIMICEDDLTFQTNQVQINELITEFYNNNKLSVLCISSNHFNELPISNNLSLTTNTQTASCYVIKKDIVDDLIKVFSDSIEMLKKSIDSRFSAIDQTWKLLQIKYFFAIPTKKIAFQRESFSDIEHKIVDYKV